MFDEIPKDVMEAATEVVSPREYCEFQIRTAVELAKANGLTDQQIIEIVFAEFAFHRTNGRPH